MPIVRLSRDKRGLDTVYLIDTAHDQRRGGRARVLYVWTAPPGLRVGRQAFDLARRQALEKAYPHLTFEWDALTQALETARQQAPAVGGADPRRDGWRAGRAARPRSRGQEAEDGPPAEKARPDDSAAPDVDQPDAPAAEAAESSEDTAPGSPRARRRRRRGRRPDATAASTSSPDL